jgi:tRNA (guanine-N7-)-methyltransferase
LGINLDHRRQQPEFMGHHGQMRAQPEVGLAAGFDPDAPVDTQADQRLDGRPESNSARGYLPATSFRSRRSALSNGQRETWERLWPELGLTVAEIQQLDTRAWFGRSAPLILEIGCGSGTSTLAMAQAEPHIDVIAVEIYRRGLAQLLSGIEREQVGNIRLMRGNGLDVLRDLIPSETLTGVRVFFPDPWPKSRHHKRRLLQPATVNLIADRLQSGGVLHAATDHAGYAEQIAEVGDAEPRLYRVNDPDELPISITRPTTKYETKAEHAGSAVNEFIWKKR